MSEGIEKPDPRDPPLAEADTAVFDAAVDRARARVVVEQSRADQDYTVAGGTRFLRETNDVALVGGISIPIGRFDRTRGISRGRKPSVDNLRDRKSTRLNSSH